MDLIGLVVLAVIGIIILGPEETAKLAYKFGRWMREVQKMSREFKAELEREVDLTEIREETRKIENEIRAAAGFDEADLRGYHPGAQSESSGDPGVQAGTESKEKSPA